MDIYIYIYIYEVYPKQFDLFLGLVVDEEGRVLVKFRDGSRDPAFRFYFFWPRKQYQEASDKKDKDVEAVKTLELQASVL